MRLRCWLTLVLTSYPAWSASKPHVIVFGKWTAVKVVSGPDEDRTVELRVRPLYVDGKLKEYTFGLPHEITERVFVVRRAVRVNDTLPTETAAQWNWQRSGWLLVDRMNGHLSSVTLPEFDVENSAASWYRDYAAYCGITADGKLRYAIVVQLGRKKPVLRKSLGDVSEGAPCSAPKWQRQPPRVTFDDKSGQLTYAVHGSVAEIETDDDSNE